jgi:hypothetical protein
MTWREAFQLLAEWYAILAVLALVFHRSDVTARRTNALNAALRWWQSRPETRASSAIDASATHGKLFTTATPASAQSRRI